MPHENSFHSRLERIRSVSELRFDAPARGLLAVVEPAFREKGQSRLSRIWRIPPVGPCEAVTDGTTAEGLPRPRPGGGALAFAAERNVAGKFDVFLMSGEKITSLGELAGTVEAMEWTPDGRSIIVLSADQGLDLAGSKGGVRVSWSDDDDPEVTAPQTARRRLLAIEYPSGKCREVGPEALSVWEFALLPDGSGAVIIASHDASERGWHRAGLYIVDFTGRTIRQILQPEWQLQCPVVSPSGKDVAIIEGWASDRGLVAGDIRLLSIADGTTEWIRGNAVSDTTWIEWRDDRNLWFAGWAGLGSVYGSIGRDGTLGWSMCEDAQVGNAVRAAIVPNPDGRGIAAIREAAGSPPEVFVRETIEVSWARITSFNQKAALDITGYPQVRAVRWKGVDGTDLEGFVLLPEDHSGGPLPMIVSVHGGPTWSVKYAYDVGGATSLAAAGFAVFLPNYRGNTGWGQSFARLNLGDPCGAEFADILAGIDWCVEQKIADAGRIGITGMSYGGYLTAWAVAVTDRFKAAAMVSGISDHLSCHYSCNHAFSEFILRGSPSEEPYAALARARSPLSCISCPVTPTLILHGKDDRCTPLGQAQSFYSIILEKGGAAELVVYAREGHGFQERVHRIDAVQRTIAWFGHHLLGCS